MPGKPDKQHRIRVCTLDGKPRDQNAINKLKSNQLGMPHLDIVITTVAHELIICASTDSHIEQVHAKLQGAGLQAMDGGDTTIPVTAAAARTAQQPARQEPPRGGQGLRGAQQHSQQGTAIPANGAPPLKKKPFGFVALPKHLTTAAPIWHDGDSSKGRLSGEVRFELETLTPLLVGWERQPVVAKAGEEPDWAIESRPEGDFVSMNLDDRWSRPIAPGKSVLCPLRAPWGKRPVIIPGDSLKGLLRHELGALLGAPMERVAERSYSYRPNALFTKDAGPKLVARIARVPNDGVEMRALDDKTQVRVPTKLELLPTNLRYDRKREQSANYYRFDDGNGAMYRGPPCQYVLQPL